MYVQHLQGNLSSPDAHPWEFELGPKTLVVGANGTGKTRIAHGLRLITTDSTDDLLGKNDVKSVHTLAQLAPFPGPGNLFVMGTFDDGQDASWGLMRSDQGTISGHRFEPPTGVDLAAVLPLRTLRAAMSGDEKARASFLAWVGSGLTVDDVLAEVPTHLANRFRDIYDKQSGNPVDRLLKVLSYAQETARGMEEQAVHQDTTVKTFGEALTEKPSDEDIAQAKSRVASTGLNLTAARAFEAAKATSNTNAPNIEGLQNDAGTAQTAVQGWDGEVRRLAQEIETTRADVNPRSLPLDADLARILDHRPVAHQCPTCRAEPGESTLDAWKAYFAHQSSEWQTAETARQAQVNAHLTELRQQHDTARATHIQWQNHLAGKQGELSRARGHQAVALPPNPGITSAEAAQHLEQAQHAADTIQRAAGAWDQVKYARDRAAALRAEKPSYENLAEHCRAASRTLLAKASQSFVDRVRSYLPPECDFGMQLTEQVGEEMKDVFRVGFWRDVAGEHMLVTALSGAQKDSMDVAVAMVVAELGGSLTTGKKGARKATRTTPGGYTLILPPDIDRDPKTLADLLRAWSKYPGQVVVMSTEMPAGRMSKDWTVIDMDAWLEKRMGGSSPGGEVGGPAGAVQAPAPILSLPPPVAPPPPATVAPPPVTPEPGSSVEEENYDRPTFVPGVTLPIPVPTASPPPVLAELPPAPMPRPPEIAPNPTVAAPQGPLNLPPAPTLSPPTPPTVVPPPEPTNVEEAVLVALGFLPDQIAMLPLGSKRRAHIVTHQIPRARAMIMPSSVTIYDRTGNPAATITE